VTRIRWSDSAVEQFQLIRRLELRRRVWRAIGGLARFPLHGRVPPEVSRFPDLDLPGGLREIVFPRLLRVFYSYQESTDTVRVLGILFRGQDVGEDWFRKILED
jgi:plasmid stabilization system protein ParE